MLFKTALKNLKKSPLMNIICLLQLTAVFLIAAVMTSAMSVRYQTYLPLKKYLSQRGIFVYYHPVMGYGAMRPGGDMNDGVFSTEELLDYMNADSMITIRHQPVMVTTGLRQYVATYQYDDELLESWVPEIAEGRWLSTDADELEIVVSPAATKAKVGDEISFMTGIPLDEDSITVVKARVVGILKEDANVLGMARAGTQTHQYMYCSLENPSMQNGAVFCVSQSVWERIMPPGYGDQPIDMAFYMYNDDVPEEVIEEAMVTAANMNAQFRMQLKGINKNSKEYLWDELMKFLPIVVILLILTTVSSVSASAISTRRRLKDYAKYYIIGLQWRQCALVNLFQALTVGVTALIISFGGLVVIGKTSLAETFMIIWNAPMILTLLGILAFYLVFSMIMPLLMLRSVTPKSLLQSE